MFFPIEKLVSTIYFLYRKPGIYYLISALQALSITNMNWSNMGSHFSCLKIHMFVVFFYAEASYEIAISVTYSQSCPSEVRQYVPSNLCHGSISSYFLDFHVLIYHIIYNILYIFYIYIF